MKIKPRVGWVRANQAADESTAPEILKLLKTIDDLRAHIANSETAAPEGTEGLAQGEEKITLHFRYEHPHYGFIDGGEAFSWNEIVALLGPILISRLRNRNLRINFETPSSIGSKISLGSKFMTGMCGTRNSNR
ncbi:MAG TPA: hypothetical protein VFW44_03580 [Bryobacteraceae bacterium]|nr:hypothetical protein [Bryobacteraceae bacterium]